MSSRLSRFVQSVGRRRLPRLFWDGTGTVVRKVQIPGREAGAWIFIPHVMTRYLRGFVPGRWVVVVRSRTGMDHYVAVEAAEWEHLTEGEILTSDRALFPEFGSEVFNANRWKRAVPSSGRGANPSGSTRTSGSSPDDQPPASAKAVYADVERRADRLAVEWQALEERSRKFGRPRHES